MSAAPQPAPAGLLAEVLALLGRPYPLLSGRGALASSAALRRLVPPRSRPVWARVAGCRCLVPLDDLVGRAAFLFGDLDRKLTRVVESALAPGDVAVDAGANLGIVALHMARRVGPSGRVFAAEPSPRLQGFLEATRAANPGLPLKIWPVALRRAEAEMTLSVPPGNAGQGSLLCTPGSEASHQSYRVMVRRLDALLAAEGVDRVALLKIDVEGYEAEVLAGLLDGGSALRPPVIVLEEHAPARSRAFALLRAEGYALYGIPRQLWRARPPVPEGVASFASGTDFIAVHASAPERLRRSLGLPDAGAPPAPLAKG